jgi:CDP-diacylglycerol--glycerol-3-phosphate 3-phosphatidyltransferase
VSDVLDGYIARKTNTASRFGAIFDSIADFVFTVIVLSIFIPLIAFEGWMLYWIGAVAAVRALTLAAGFVKYRAFAYLHTYANKVTGIALICFPVLLNLFGLAATAFVLCGIASLSALEELIITTRTKTLNRDIRGCWEMQI